MKKFIAALFFLSVFLLLEFNEVYCYTCVETSSYTLPPMGWLVRRFTCAAVHPMTGATITWNKIVISDGNGGTVWEDEDFNRKLTLPSKDIDLSKTISIYPNPANSYININTQGYKGMRVNISMYDLQFRNISILYDDYVNAENLHLLIPNLPTGYYYLTVNDGIKIISQSLSIIK